MNHSEIKLWMISWPMIFCNSFDKYFQNFTNMSLHQQATIISIKSVADKFCKKGHSVMEMQAYGSERVFYNAFLKRCYCETVFKRWSFLAKKDKGHCVAKRAIITSRIIIAYSFKLKIDFLLSPISGRGYKLKVDQHSMQNGLNHEDSAIK